MAELIVSGAFAITKGSLGGGASEFWVVVSITHADGKPIDLSFAATDVDPGPIVIAIALSVGFGATFIPLHIEEIKDKNNSSFPAGFYALRVETQKGGRPRKYRREDDRHHSDNRKRPWSGACVFMRAG